MKPVIASIVIIIAGFFLQKFTPWWSIVLITGITCYFFDLTVWRALLISLVSGLILWGGYAFFLDKGNEGVLSSQIGELFGGLDGISLILLTGICGAIFGALGGILGALALKFRN